MFNIMLRFMSSNTVGNLAVCARLRSDTKEDVKFVPKTSVLCLLCPSFLLFRSLFLLSSSIYTIFTLISGIFMSFFVVKLTFVVGSRDTNNSDFIFLAVINK